MDENSDFFWEEALFADAGESLFIDDEIGPVPELTTAAPRVPELDTPRVNAEDFLDGPEREAFIRLKKAVRTAVNVNSQAADRMRAIKWLFVHGDADRDGLTCSLCCRALGIREMVVQVRTQYQLYYSCIPLPDRLPLLAANIPASLSSEILFYSGEYGLAIARELWDAPGIRADLLASLFQKDRLLARSLLELEVNGFAAISHGLWFFTGRNPQLLSAERRRRFSWSHELF